MGATKEATVRRLTDAIRTFADAMASEFDRDALLDELVHQTVAVIGADGAGIMLPDSDGDLRFAAATDARVERVEEEQALQQQGACQVAYTTRTVVALTDLRREVRWPEYQRRCTAEGLLAVLGVPLTVAGRCLGVINVYREQPSAWSDQEVDITAAMGTMAASYVLNAARHSEISGLADQLQHALDSRVVIEQAKGYLMAAGALDPQEAFERLRIEARSSGRKVRDVAQEVIDRATRDEPSVR